MIFARPLEGFDRQLDSRRESIIERGLRVEELLKVVECKIDGSMGVADALLR